MKSLNLRTWVLIFFVFLATLSMVSFAETDFFVSNKKLIMKEKVRQMFYHAYDNYMKYAFPHDELKPLTKTFTDSLSELGNLRLQHLPQNYNGSALTLIESLSSLVIMGNNTEFEKAVVWLSKNLNFDVDARVNLFECNIRVLGGLVSAHMLATDSRNRFTQGNYKNELLFHAEDLGRRLLPAFNTPTGLPYAWINLKYGVMESETTETSTSCCGSLILEMGTLSRLTGDPRYEDAALRALRKLWSMRSSLNLLGTTLDIETGEWIEYSGGIGAGVDSFYEYLAKAYILFGKEEYWRMFHSAYVAVQKYFRHDAWYHEADMRTGHATYWQLTSLQAFWPGLQVLVGDVASANSSHREFFKVWETFGVLPERFGHPKVTEFMIDSIHANYDGFYPSWSTTPRERQEHMWNHFKNKVKADDLKELELCYYLYIKKKLRDQIFRAARKKDKPIWMTPGCFAKLLSRKKDDPKFAEISKKAKENRCKGGKEGKALPTHVLGRKSAARALDSAVGMDETEDVTPFKLLELSKKNKQGKWITPRAEQIANDYMKKMAEKEAGKLNMTEDQIYLETAGGFDKKGRVYGTGETATQFFEPPNVTRSSRAGHAPNYAPGVLSKTMAENQQLKARMQEYENRQKEYEERQNMMMAFMQKNFNFLPDQSCNPGPTPFRRDDFSDDHGDSHGFGSIVPPT